MFVIEEPAERVRVGSIVVHAHGTKKARLQEVAFFINLREVTRLHMVPSQGAGEVAIAFSLFGRLLEVIGKL